MSQCGVGCGATRAVYASGLVNEETGGLHARAIRRWLGSPLVLWIIAVSPLFLAIVLLTQRPWAPVLDMAMTEVRVRDVGGPDSPLIGLPGRIGSFPEQGSHPGPASFYLLAPFYRLSGATAWGLELGSAVINTVAIGLLIWIGHRRAGLRGAVAFAAIAAIAVRGYGLTVLTHPWNPYFPLLLWLLVLVAAWSVLIDDYWMAVLVVVSGSIAAQTHVPYLVSAIAMCALVLGTMLWRMRSSAGRDVIARPFAATVALGAVLWVPAFIDQALRDPGNIRMLVRHFASESPEQAIGLAGGARVFFRHLDAPTVLVDLFRDGDAFVQRSGMTDSSWVPGLLVFVLWIGAAAVAHRRGHRALDALNTVIALALVVGALSMIRIFGKVWFYLTLWAWGTLLLVLLSIAWTAWHLIRRQPGPPDDDRVDRHRVIVGIGAATISVCTVLSLHAATVHEVPQKHLSDGLRAVYPETEQALRDGLGPAVGPDGRYLVYWQQAYIGSQGYGLLNELDRAGFEVGVQNTWRVPVTPQRVFAPGSYDAEVHLVSGMFIEDRRERDGFVEVVAADVRTDEERRRFDELRDQVLQRLTEIGRDELIEGLDENLFGVSLDPDLPSDVVAAMSEMLLVAEPVAVFLAPPGP